jgi:Protein of unknown function (DUF669)
MNFTPKSDEELQMESLMPEGSYSYQVIKAEDKVSQAGNEYTAITLKVWDDEGKEHQVFTNMALIKLLKHFCDVNNMQDEYKSGNIPPENFLYKSCGKVMLKIEGEKPNGKGGMYRAKNVVSDYIVAPHGSTLKPLPEVKNDFPDDDIPF